MALTIIIVAIAICALFMFLTRPMSFEVTPDTSATNADKENTKVRPFTVDKQEYPFKSHWFTRDGVSMHYVDEGEGVPVLLCHGNPDWSFLYRNIIKELSGEARLIAPDLPGFGYSETPPGYRFTPQEHVEWLNALVFEHLKLEKFIVVVGDWGGPTGLSVATTHPERVCGLVITNTLAFEAQGLTKLWSYAGDWPMAQRLFLNRNFLPGVVIPTMINKKARRNKAITDAYIMPYPTPETRHGPAAFPGEITKQGPWLAALEGRLQSLADKPVEFIFGLKDPLLAGKKIRAKWQNHFPNANVTNLPDANHFTQEDSPESFAKAIRNILRKV